jgi:hypothetical protein
MNRIDLEHFLKSINFNMESLDKFGLSKYKATIMFDGTFYKIYYKTPMKGSTNLLTLAINFKLAKYPVNRPAKLVATRQTILAVFEYEMVPAFTYYETDWSKTVDDFIHCLKVINKQ